MITTYLTQSSGQITCGKEDQISQWQHNQTGHLWIDIEHGRQNSSETEALLRELGCHPLAIQDVLRQRHPPKIEAFEEQLFILYRGISRIIDDLVFEHQQIGFFISKRCLITVHAQPSLGIEKVVSSPALKEILSSPMALALRIMHTSAGLYLDSVLSFEADLITKEDQIHEGLGEGALTELASYKAQLTRIKRVFNYHLSLSQALKGDRFKQLPFDLNECEHLINDVDDRFERLHSLSQLFYDICSDMIDSYITITSHQMNNTMRVLTVITAVFVPLSFLAGIYGMNFEHMPELHFRYAYYVLIAAMVLIAFSLIGLFKRKKWF